jgi:hypothetical protein
VNPDDYGWLRMRLEEPEPLTFDGRPMHDMGLKIPVVYQADPVVSASAELIEMGEREGWVRHGVLRVGTPGHGLGEVEYRISEHPAGLEYRVLTKVGTDRDR